MVVVRSLARTRTFACVRFTARRLRAGLRARGVTRRLPPAPDAARAPHRARAAAFTAATLYLISTDASPYHHLPRVPRHRTPATTCARARFFAYPFLCLLLPATTTCHLPALQRLPHATTTYHYAPPATTTTLPHHHTHHICCFAVCRARMACTFGAAWILPGSRTYRLADVRLAHVTITWHGPSRVNHRARAGRPPDDITAAAWMLNVALLVGSVQRLVPPAYGDCCLLAPVVTIPPSLPFSLLFFSRTFCY